MIKLTPIQIKYLKIFSGLKAFARQENLDRDLGHDVQKQIETELLKLGVLKQNKKGSLSGPSYNDTRELIALNTVTIEELKVSIQERKSQNEAHLADMKNRQSIDKNYCFYSRDMDNTATYGREELERLNNTLKKMEKVS